MTRRRLKLLAVPLVAALAGWFLQYEAIDAQLDWMFVQAVLDGENPYAPVGETAARYGVSFVGEWTPPRLPAQLLLQLPWALVPLEYVAPVGRAVTAGALAALFVVLRPSLWWLFLIWPAMSAMYYGNASAVVSLLVAVWFVRRSGVALGVATAIRAWPWFIGLCLFVAGRRREAVTAGTVFLVLNAAGLLLPGVTLERVVDGFINGRVVEQVSANLTRGVPLWLAVLIGISVLAFLRWQPRYMVLAVPYALVVSPLVWFHYLPVLAVVRSESTGLDATTMRLNPRPISRRSRSRATGTMAP